MNKKFARHSALQNRRAQIKGCDYVKLYTSGIRFYKTLQLLNMQNYLRKLRYL